MTEGKRLVDFVAEQTTFGYVAAFGAPIFELLESGPRLMAALYRRFAAYGVDVRGIRVEQPLGSPADAQLTCTISRLSLLLRYRVDRIELWTDVLELVGEEQLRTTLITALAVLRDVAAPAIATHTFNVAVHGTLSGSSLDEQLRRWVPTGPSGEPAFHPIGVSFGYQRNAAEGEGTLVLERSASVPGGAFLRMTSVHAGGISEEDAFRAAWKFFDETADRFGLEIARGG